MLAANDNISNYFLSISIVACLCNLNGTANASILSFGDCVRDEDVLSLYPGKVRYCSGYQQAVIHSCCD